MPKLAPSLIAVSATSNRPPVIANSFIVALTRWASSVAANLRLAPSSVESERKADSASRSARASASVSVFSVSTASLAAVSAASAGNASGATRCLRATA